MYYNHVNKSGRINTIINYSKNLLYVSQNQPNNSISFNIRIDDETEIVDTFNLLKEYLIINDTFRLLEPSTKILQSKQFEPIYYDVNKMSHSELLDFVKNGGQNIMTPPGYYYIDMDFLDVDFISKGWINLNFLNNNILENKYYQCSHYLLNSMYKYSNNLINDNLNICQNFLNNLEHIKSEIYYHKINYINNITEKTWYVIPDITAVEYYISGFSTTKKINIIRFFSYK